MDVIRGLYIDKVFDTSDKAQFGHTTSDCSRVESLIRALNPPYLPELQSPHPFPTIYLDFLANGFSSLPGCIKPEHQLLITNFPYSSPTYPPSSPAPTYQASLDKLIEVRKLHQTLPIFVWSGISEEANGIDQIRSTLEEISAMLIQRGDGTPIQDHATIIRDEVRKIYSS